LIKSVLLPSHAQKNKKKICKSFTPAETFASSWVFLISNCQMTFGVLLFFLRLGWLTCQPEMKFAQFVAFPLRKGKIVAN